MLLQSSKSASLAWRVCMAALVAVLVLALLPLGAQRANAASANGKVIVGYWHNFDNGSTNIKLRDISPAFDIVQVAFAEPVGGSHSGNMVFTPYNATVSEFQADVDFLQSRGQKVLISIGGANGTLELTTAAGKQTFVSTMKSIIDTYGFDGFDIDLEGSSLALNAGDTDFKNPTTPKITNLIAASQEILASYGPNFLLTMAPETAYVQGGASTYGGPWGAYLPVIYNLRNQLDYLHVQHYNSGSMMGLDGRSYSQGTPDFHVAMAEMLLQGFPVGNNPNNLFPALRADQIVIGLPASPQAAGGGYTTPANVHKALDYLIKGQSFGGSYVLRNPAGYPDLSGVMTWSINWDKYVNYEFSTSHRAYLDALGGGGGGDTTAPTVPTGLQSMGATSTSVGLSWNASNDNVGVTGYIVTYGSSSVTVPGTATSTTISGLVPSTSYTFTVKARDAANNQSAASAPVTVVTGPAFVDTLAPSVPSGLQSTGKTSTSVTLSWNASTDNVGVAGYTVSYGSTSLNSTGTSVTVNGLTANTAYTFTVKAFDAAGNISEASAPVTVTTNAPSTCAAPAWNPATAYGGGARVSYNGTEYESKWWTQGDQPDLSGQWGVWKVIGPCGGGGNPDTAAPTAPTNLSATGATTSSVSLSWSASTDNVGVIGYTVYYGSASVNVTGTTATISGLSAGTSYTFTVKARDEAGNLSAASNSLQASTQQDSGGTTTWAAGVSYQAGNVVTYNGVTYVCLQPHTSLAGWEPPNVPALWDAQ
ncbi:fibronectin type III domain-containing protein [Paenibacillus sp. LHD-117]|uniref:fibronectin type III domain-containing protein n=1 Tax=Paenibacillus sp. LHD-117 TaxID=3071412 RepID=UPI0027E0532B|nr:fibronectin type III domain-containing protein [Paenibacillus sp. LHD-117]MDQ6419014.1 fibronectin type III domain-containing protein [Paenibacillus sp. LHD-117]